MPMKIATQKEHQENIIFKEAPNRGENFSYIG